MLKNTIHGNWIPAVHAGMTALRLDVNINSSWHMLRFLIIKLLPKSCHLMTDNIK
jgi:hypothetical protein